MNDVGGAGKLQGDGNDDDREVLDLDHDLDHDPHHERGLLGPPQNIHKLEPDERVVDCIERFEVVLELLDLLQVTGLKAVGVVDVHQERGLEQLVVN